MIQFQKLLVRVLKGYLTNLFASRVRDEERLCRYIFSKKHYSRVNNVIKYGAFLPRHGETSVFRTCLLFLLGYQIVICGI